MIGFVLSLHRYNRNFFLSYERLKPHFQKKKKKLSYLVLARTPSMSSSCQQTPVVAMRSARACDLVDFVFVLFGSWTLYAALFSDRIAGKNLLDGHDVKIAFLTLFAAYAQLRTQYYERPCFPRGMSRLLLNRRRRLHKKGSNVTNLIHICSWYTHLYVCARFNRSPTCIGRYHYYNNPCIRIPCAHAYIVYGLTSRRMREVVIPIATAIFRRV